MMNKSFKKTLRIAIIVIAVLSIIGVFNFHYFWKQAHYYLSPNFKQATQQDLQPKNETPVMDANQLLIPNLNISAPINYVAQIDEALFQTALQTGVVHYPGTSQLGKTGNAYIFGHSSDFAFAPGNFKTVFALLPKIQLGDKIYVSDAEGKVFTYQVTDTKVVESNDLSVLSQETNGQKILSLQTSYPLGTALRRFIVISQLIE